MWLAIIKPLTRWADGRYGDLLDRATWMLAGPQGMKLASFLSRILWRLLCTYPKVRISEGLSPLMKEKDATRSYLCGIDLSLNDVEDSDVAVARLPLPPCGNHHILGLQKPPHHIQHCGFSYTCNLKWGALFHQDVILNVPNIKVGEPQLTDWSVVSGVYPVMRKWRRGVGIRDAIRPIRSLFM